MVRLPSLEPTAAERRAREKRAAALYALVRDQRPAWTRLSKAERRWWINGGYFNVADELDSIHDDYPTYRRPTDRWTGEGGEPHFEGTEYHLAVNREKQHTLELAHHRPRVIRATVTRFDGSVIQTVAIDVLCEGACKGCDIEADRIADEWEADLPAADPFVHETTLGPQRFQIVSYDSVPARFAIQDALEGPQRDALDEHITEADRALLHKLERDMKRTKKRRR